MAELIIPYLAVGSGDEITIDGVVYKVPRVDSDGRLSVAVNSSALPTGAATSARQDTMITALQLIDDLRAALAAVATDRLLVNVFRTGASEVIAVHYVGVNPSTTRATIATPTAGKKIRLLSVQLAMTSTVISRFEVYFGTGADITTTPAKAVLDVILDVDFWPSFFAAWPDGAGPVGAVDDVLSFRTSANTSTDARIIVLYREE